MLALDLDGTLTDSRKRISSRTKEALMQMQREGHTLVLASGRPTQGILPLAGELKMEEYGGYVLSYNGGRIMDCRTQSLIYQQTLPMDIVPEVFQMAEKLGIGMLSYEGDSIITGMHYDEYMELEKNINHLPLRQIPNVGEYIDFPVNKCLGTAEPEIAAAAEQEYLKAFGDRASISRSEPFFVEVLPLGVNKATSLERLCEITGHSREDLIACGDGFNDVDMVEYAGLGVAMENAQEAVKRVADYITASNDEDGVAEVVYRFIIQENRTNVRKKIDN